MALVSVHYRSGQLKKNVEIQPVVPDCNGSFTKPLSEYPVVYLLHGMSEDASFIDRLQACCAKTLVEVGNPVQGGEEIRWDVDAGFNGYYNHPVGRGYFKAAEL